MSLQDTIEIGVAKLRPSAEYKTPQDISNDAYMAQLRLHREYIKSLKDNKPLTTEEIDRIIGSCGFDYDQIAIMFDHRYLTYRFPTDALYK